MTHNIRLQQRIESWMAAIKLPEQGNIDAAQAGICWNDDDMFAIVDMSKVEAAKLAKTRTGPAAKDLKTWERAEYTHGACWEEWMERPRFTPEAYFAERCHSGSMPSGEEFLDLLKQFARIKECDWARAMLAALMDPDPFEYDLEGYDPDQPAKWLKQERVDAASGSQAKAPSVTS
jgi:hypothetical protein